LPSQWHAGPAAGEAVSRPVGPQPKPTVWIKWVKQVASRRKAVSAAEYDRLKPEGAPSARTLMRWADKPWSGVCADAGKSPGGAAPSPWSADAKIAALKAAGGQLDPGEHLTVRRYRDWRLDQPHSHDHPSAAAFGDSREWLRWCERAEIVGGVKQRRHRHTDRQVLEHLIAAGDGSGHVGTTGYEQYRRLHPDAPSRATIIARHADWNTAQSAAADLATAQRHSSSRRARRSTTSGQPPPR
jgi:hypothetical protein